MEKHVRPLTRHGTGPVLGQGGVGGGTGGDTDGGDYVSTGNIKLDMILRIYTDLYAVTSEKFALLLGG